MKELAWSGEAVFRFLSCVHLFWWQSPVPLNYQKSKFAQLCLHAPVFRIKIFQPQCAALCPWSQQLWVCASGSRFPLPVWYFLYQTDFLPPGRWRCSGRRTTWWPPSPTPASSSLAPLLFARRRERLLSSTRGKDDKGDGVDLSKHNPQRKRQQWYQVVS